MLQAKHYIWLKAFPANGLSGDADEMDLDLSKFCLSDRKYLLFARLV